MSGPAPAPTPGLGSALIQAPKGQTRTSMLPYFSLFTPHFSLLTFYMFHYCNRKIDFIPSFILCFINKLYSHNMISIFENSVIKTDDELQVQNVLEESYWYSGDAYVTVPPGGSKSIQIQFLAFALGSYKCQVIKKTDTCIVYICLISYWLTLFHKFKISLLVNWFPSLHVWIVIFKWEELYWCSIKKLYTSHFILSSIHNFSPNLHHSSQLLNTKSFLCLNNFFHFFSGCFIGPPCRWI